ncbi:hypothetical protein B566_EDAN014204 [Ephemera danica]|nr:hypothetical protein B566_EDAN014204 [Ephemera danica]
MDNFYLTLPSKSSFDIFPENRTTCFTTQLPQRIHLQGSWEVSVVEYVGDTLAPLLRIIHVDKSNYIFGAQTVSLYDSPHYIKVSKTEFETIELDLRTVTVEVCPFMFGTSSIKLHFRRATQLKKVAVKKRVRTK